MGQGMAYLLLVLLGLAGGAPPKPHVVFMVIDDLGWADVGYHGGVNPTPNIDRLAAGGVRLDRYYVQPSCSPTRSAFMTGRYPFHTGMHQMLTLVPGSTAHLPTDHPTLPEMLKQAGYVTHMVGKWHLGYAKWEYTPYGRGFDSYIGYLQGECDYYNKTMGAKDLVGYDFWVNDTVAWSGKGKYSLDQYIDAVEGIINGASPDVPLFLYFSHQTVHIPLEAPPQAKWEEACRAKGLTGPRLVYCSMLADLDDTVGRLEAMLRAKGMWEHTLLVVTTDNGGMPDYQDAPPSSYGSNWPLRAGKTTVFEGGVRGVGFVQGGVLPAESRNTNLSHLMHASDWLPTILDCVGVEERPADLDGVSQWDAIVAASTAAPARDEVPVNLYTHGLEYSAIIVGDWKLIVGNLTGAYDGYWTISPYRRLPSPETEEEPFRLFNLADDPSERTNLAASHPAKRDELLARIAHYLKRYVHPQENVMHPKSLPSLHNGTWAPFLE